MPSLINAEPVKQRLIAELRDWAGSDIEMAGPVSIENFFSLSVNLSHVEFKGLKGIPNLKSLRAERLIARIAWSDLAFGNLDFNKVRIVDATAHLAPIEPDAAATAIIGMLAPPDHAPFTALSVANCIVTIDAAPNQPERTLAIENVASNLRKSDQRVEIDGRVRWKGEELGFEAITYAPLTNASAAPVPLQINLSSRLLNASFDGRANLAGYLTGTGKFMSNTPDALALAKWLEMDPGAVVAEPAGVSGMLDLSGARISLQSAAFSLAGENAAGDINIGLDGPGLAIDGALAFDDVDIHKLWALNLGDEQVFPARGDAEWRFFQQSTLDVSVSASRPRWNALTLGPIAFALTGKSGVVSAEIAELGLVGGSLLGHVEVDLNGTAPRASARLTGEDIDADQVLAMAAQPGWLTGKVEANIEAEISGQTPAQLYKSASVNARVSFPQGGQVQLDIPRLAHGAEPFSREGWDGAGFTPSQFERLRLQLIMADQALRFSDLDLATADGAVRGSGDVDLARQLLDWQLQISARTGDGSRPQDGTSPSGSLFIKGPWARPSIRLIEQAKKASGQGEAKSDGDAGQGRL